MFCTGLGTAAGKSGGVFRAWVAPLFQAGENYRYYSRGIRSLESPGGKGWLQKFMDVDLLGYSPTYSAFTIQMTTLFSEGGQSLLKAKNGHCFIETFDHQRARISKDDADDILRTGGSLTAGEKLQWTIGMYRQELKQEEA